MQRKQNIKRKSLGVLAVFGLLIGVGITLMYPNSAYAITCDASSMISCIDITFGEVVGGTNLLAPTDDKTTSHGIDKAYFYLPVTLTIAGASNYSVQVYSENNGELRSTNGGVIPTLSGDAGKGTTLQALGAEIGSNGGVWGYRYNIGDEVNDASGNYLGVPSKGDTASNIISQQAIPVTDNAIKRVLTLGFATAVDGNLAAGKYSDKIVVAVTASPRQTSAFGAITTMQEMTPDICKAITTPSKDAVLTDSTGIHAGDNRYIPEAILIDKRDDKEYLVRKLADGNCWMSQNLSLMLDKSKALSDTDTDLNTKATWTPQNTTQTAEQTGTKWVQADNNARSSADGWDEYWTGASNEDAFSKTGDPAYGGTDGYNQRGVYYNWFAATAGSGTATLTGATTNDSICPKGWRLPVGNTTAVGKTDGSVKSFYNLVQIYTGKTGDFTTDENGNVASTNTLYTFPMSFVPAGNYGYNGGTLNNVSERQFYWSATAHSTDANYARALGFHSSDHTVYPGTDSYSKGSGFSIRCVSR